ncbi:hypothetical protein AYJ54_20475 [Bradyrhizobium centrolobii]|uniref:Uncharacterized protein n=1 Tax=Bradyrhizobium centrolobii TaxID=1505087 RepID=A0A176YK60_9BRAD|nr:hypothetical protein [Bradyrhizobium centrolobii]OAF06067.1 hypothetical protein AYJ54_20475 [Bradyrhizobium centrolobii]
MIGEPRPIEQLLFVSTPDENPICFSIIDMIEESTVVAEKIIDVCGDSKIFLELNIRGAD